MNFRSNPMIHHYTEKELKDKLSALTIIADTREQRGEHILAFLDEKKVPHIERKLSVGDYSCQLGAESFERDFAVERKHGLDELVGNMTADRDRFEREFLRAKASGTKVFLLVEDATWEDAYLGNYRSKLSPKSLIGSLLSWQTRFNVTVLFCDRNIAPRLIYGILYYSAREVLLGGEI